MSDLSSWCLRHYEALKDFAGPTATIVASLTATGIAFWFGKIQARLALQQNETARQQAATAHDRLRLDLFQMRYDIYTTVRDALADVVYKQSQAQEFDPDSVRPLLQALGEGEFLLPPEVCGFIQSAHRNCENLYGAHIVLRAVERQGGDTDPITTRFEEALDIVQDQLLETQLVFAGVLGFR